MLNDVSHVSAGLEECGSWNAALRRHRKRDETVFDVEIRSTALSFGGGQARLVLAKGVSAERRLESQLRQAQKMDAVGRLAAGVAHDFNNILGVVTGYVEIVLRTMPAEDPRARKLKEVLKAADRATGLTRQLRTFSRKDLEQPQVFRPRDRLVDLHVVGLYDQPAALGHGVPGVDRQVHQDLLDLSRVRFDVPQIWLRDGREGDVLADQWPQHLFHPRDDGVEIQLLLVEDDDALRSLAREVLEEHGYIVLEAADGSEAAVAAAGHRVDLLLTDVVLRTTTGVALAEQLAQGRSDLRVLYMSGYTARALVSQQELPRGTSFLQKPFTVDALLRRVREILDSSPRNGPGWLPIGRGDELGIRAISQSLGRRGGPLAQAGSFVGTSVSA